MAPTSAQTSAKQTPKTVEIRENGMAILSFEGPAHSVHPGVAIRAVV